MATFLIHIEKDDSNNPALFASYLNRDDRVFFRSESPGVTTAAFDPANSPFDADQISVPSGSEVVSAVVVDEGTFPFTLQNPTWEAERRARVEVVEPGSGPSSEKVGFLFDEKGRRIYQVYVGRSELPMGVSIVNATGVQQLVYLKPRFGEHREKRLDEGQEPIEVYSIPELASGKALAVYLPDNANGFQGGGTIQVDIVVDPDA